MIKENDYSGIKKKEYDLVCLSMLENISSILKEFNEIQKLFVISCSIQKDKRVHIVTERCIKIISILCNIFEDDKKKELYVSDVIQVLDVVGTFIKKRKEISHRFLFGSKCSNLHINTYIHYFP